MRPISSLFAFGLSLATALACSSCSDPSGAQHKRLVRRMQPEALDATTGPTKPLEWGQINFLHTTDTHGWLEGHLKEENYGADWGDYVSFVKRMRKRADELKVDLLLIDTGDLHDGAGLSDASEPSGLISRDIFAEIDYDLLAIGNHELYVTEIAYGTFANFSEAYGEKYLASNVQIIDKETNEWRQIGKRYRYFQTKHGLRIMAFGVLFDFDGNSNVTKVTKAEDMIKEPWFTDAVNHPEPIDLFILIGHNPVRQDSEGATLAMVHKAIRDQRSDVPIQMFGGHAHVRDFAVYDETSTALASGRYCETLGWLSLTGIESPTYTGECEPNGVPNPTRKAIANSTTTDHQKRKSPQGKEGSSLRYARRYLDWNRLTFAYHGANSQDHDLDSKRGKGITHDITGHRKDLNLTYVFGCAPQTYCMTCREFGSEGSIYSVVEKALAKVVVNPDRAKTPRLILTNTGSVRFDLVQGPFTVDDGYIVSPFQNTIDYIPDVPYSQAREVLDIMNAGPWQKRDLEEEENLVTVLQVTDDVCTNPPLPSVHDKRDILATRSVKRQLSSRDITPGYTTSDDFGTDGDDTPHSEIPSFEMPNDLQANASFPTDGTEPETVDVVFVSFIGADYVVPALNSAGGDYSADDIQHYMPEDFTSDQILPSFAAAEWQENMPNCPVGDGVGP